MDLHRALHGALNDAQRQAVYHDQGPLLVLSGAGSGKTRVITYRIARVIAQGAAASSVLAVTFTNRAAAQMRDRAQQLLGNDVTGLWVGTFHAIGAKLLRMHGSHIGISPQFVIYDDADQRALLKQILEALNIPERRMSARQAAWLIDQAKNAGISADRYEAYDDQQELFAGVYRNYEQRLEQANAVDFGDLLLKTLRLLLETPALADCLAEQFVHLLVDEFQDTNTVQYQLVRRLSSIHRNLCVVGDDDQSIYAWRGAEIKNILSFEDHYPDAAIVRLEQNYRSTQVILDAAAAVIEANRNRLGKQLWTTQSGGDPIAVGECADDIGEAQWIVANISKLRQSTGYSFDDIAIFYRTHAQSRVIEEALRSAHPQIPYRIYGGVRFFDRAEIKDIIGYLRVLVNPADDMGLLRIINVPPRGIGQTTIERLTAHARQHQLTLWEALDQCVHRSEAVTSIATATKKKLRLFFQLMDELRVDLPQMLPSALTDQVLHRSGYAEMLAADGSHEADDRRRNLMELLVALRQYESTTQAPSLLGFLEQCSLATDQTPADTSQGVVTLMTVHSAKGLEFKAVFVAGLEDGIFPLARAMTEPEELEEERRLAYVALTRAEKRLFLSFAQRRWLYGQQKILLPSQFLRRIPQALLQASGPTTAARKGFGQTNRISSWDDDSHYNQDNYSDYGDDFDQSESHAGQGFFIGMKVQHPTFGVGEIRVITGHAENLNLTVYFPKQGAKTIRSQFVQQWRAE